jgi:hypothetical protein
MIWTHHIKDITYSAPFIPDGASSTETYDGKIYSQIVL